MPQLRINVADPLLGSVAFGPLALSVQQDGKQRFLAVDFESDPAGGEPAEAVGFRELCAHHQLGEPELVPDKPQPAAKATESTEKEQ